MSATQYINNCILWGQIFRHCSQALQPKYVPGVHLAQLQWSPELHQLFQELRQAQQMFEHRRNLLLGIPAAAAGQAVTFTVQPQHHAR